MGLGFAKVLNDAELHIWNLRIWGFDSLFKKLKKKKKSNSEIKVQAQWFPDLGFRALQLK